MRRSRTGAALAALDRVPMHLLVIGSLLAIGLVATIEAAVGVIGREPLSIVASFAVAVLASVLANAAAAGLAREAAHHRSAVITGLIIAFIAFPPSDAFDLLVIAGIAVVASASKYLIAWRGRPLANPAAVGLVLVSLTGEATEAWWVGAVWLWPFVAVLGALVAIRTRAAAMAGAYVIVAVALIVSGYTLSGFPFWQAVLTAVMMSPVLFLAGFMLTEPRTLPPKRRQRMLVAVIVAVLTAAPSLLAVLGVSTTFGTYSFQAASALIVGNLVAFAFGPRQRPVLLFADRREVGDGLVEFRFTPKAQFGFEAGQYLELHLPHRRPDASGTRRVFSVTSAPGGDVTIGVRIDDSPSTFKRELLALDVAQPVRVTRVGGDFTTPHGRLLSIAAGIGVTPFLAQLAAEPGNADRVLILLLRDGERFPYAERLSAAGVRGIVIAPNPPRGTPGNFDYVGAGRLDAARLVDLVPDIRERTVQISGATATVATLARAARQAGAKQIRTDAFSGY